MVSYTEVCGIVANYEVKIRGYQNALCCIISCDTVHTSITFPPCNHRPNRCGYYKYILSQFMQSAYKLVSRTETTGVKHAVF